MPKDKQTITSQNSNLVGMLNPSSIHRPRILLRISIVLFSVLIAWAWYFEIDQIVHATGQVIASARSQIVQAADGGVLVEMRVQEGDVVKQGQIIASLEKERAQASYSESFGKVVALRLTVARLQAEIASKDFVPDPKVAQVYPELVQNQINLYRQRRSGLQEQLKVLNDNIRLTEEELNMNLPLEKLGDISQTDIIRLKRAVNDAKNLSYSSLNKYLQDASAELNKAQEDLNSNEQIAADRQQLLEHTDIIAPATGIVKSIKVTTLGGVVRQGDELLQILPTESDLVIEAKVKPADMADIRSGLESKIKLDAYDYSIFGVMKGLVSYVSADTLSEDTKNGPLTYYRIKVNISEKEFKGKMADMIEVRPGMTATVDIRTGRRSILSFITKPITKTVKDSFGER
jgi:adhesin transport system membrane fusion protein